MGLEGCKQGDQLGEKEALQSICRKVDFLTSRLLWRTALSPHYTSLRPGFCVESPAFKFLPQSQSIGLLWGHFGGFVKTCPGSIFLSF